MKIHLTIMILFIGTLLFGQTEIKLSNPSFEDIAAHSTVPKDWFNCGTNGYSPPDIHSGFSDFFKVNHSSYHEPTYVGMIVRADNSWEAIGQVLEKPMRRNVQYQFSIYLALAENYISLSKTNYFEENFNKPVVLRIWGGSMSCHQGQLLAESVPIDHNDWQEYTFEITPEYDWEYFTLEAFFVDPTGFAYNGNLLLDNCSTLFPYGKIELAKIMDYDALSNDELYDYIIQCKADDSNLTDTSVLDIIYDSWFFEQTAYDIGMRNLVTRIDSTQLQHYFNIYEKFELSVLNDLMRKTIILHDRNSDILNEVRFLKNCEEIFKNNLITMKIEDKRLNYIRLHREEVIELLKECSF
ncbi:MAG: hypothetical protein AB8G11_00375 [Saprospiraceae bacterium]